MRKLALFLALQILALPVLAAEEPAKECSLCVGAVVAAGTPLTAVVPVLIPVGYDDLAATAAVLGHLTADQRRRTVLVVDLALVGTDALSEAEEKAKNLVEWGRLHGPFETLALTVGHPDPAVVAYAIRRVAVSAQGLNVSSRIAMAGMTREAMDQLFENGAQGYFDAVIVDGSEVAATAAWLAERDPSKKILATVEPQSPNPMYDLGKALSEGASRAYLATPADPAALASLNTALIGDFAFDSTARTAVLDAKGNPTTTPVLTFIRGEDLRALVVPRGDSSTTTIVAVPGSDFERPRRIDAGGERAITDSGRRGERLLAGLPPSTQPFAVLVDRARQTATNVTREAIDVATQRGITVEEIIRNHQSYDAFQESIQPRYTATNTTKLRFAISGGADAVEATIAGEYFSDPDGRADWVWRDFFINGVKWKYGRIPELPLIQPEKVTQLPLDIHLSNEYRYQLVRQTDLGGYRVYEVRFEPPPNAPESLPLYRGTVWIDSRTWARIRISMIQLNLVGEILSNEERVDFQPFSRETDQPITPAGVAALDPRQIIWLPVEVSAQQVISAAGRANAIERATTFTGIRLNPDDFDTRLQQVNASESLMVRETDAGLRYLEKRGDGERVVKEGFDTSQFFMVGGIHHDAGLEFPVVPLGGIDYFNFDLFGKGIQTNIFFAGVILAVNATHPNVGNTRTNVGADFFGIAIPFENTMYRDGEARKDEGVKVRPLVLTMRAGHPVFNFGKVDLSFTAAHLTYQKGAETADGFQVPKDTFLFGPSLSTTYARRGYSLTAFYDYTTRSTWEPWGNLAEFDEDQKTFTKFGFSIAKSFFLPKFQRISVDFDYLHGQNLDRFSKYELGFFGAQRIHGIQSGTVRAERAMIAHLSYGFVFSQQFRIEAFYDHGLIDDELSGLSGEPFQGLGIAGQTVGPYGTLLRLDIGKTVGRNAQDGFVANVVVLKLF
ncbi:MAG TPA: hypothetical protein VMS98_18405 [Thermoanaerobaculia bacterium]|nr:hypothetical protein [Thermoanaerobaculia bacterium]